ncbi:MAG: family 43 glycosylhydrolase [Propionicimonas sp.]
MQSVGHADLVEWQGRWWACYHGTRPHGRTPQYHVIGRETMLCPIEWVDDWPVFREDHALTYTPDTSLTTDLTQPLDPRWVSPQGDLTNVTVTPDGLVLTPGRPLVIRVQDLNWSAETTIDVTAGTARLLVYLDDDHWYALDADTDSIRAVGRSQPFEQEFGRTTVTDPAAVDLRLLADLPAATAIGAPWEPDLITFTAGPGGQTEDLATVDGRHASTEVAGGFTGRTVGIRMPGRHRAGAQLPLPTHTTTTSGRGAPVTLDTDEFGRIEVSTIPVRADLHVLSATYTPSGKVLVFYRTDPAVPDACGIDLLNDDGTEPRTVFTGIIPQHAKANGVRQMVFADNRRVLLGDHVLECSPSLDECEHAELIDVAYPWELEQNPLISHHWSEIIISPDNDHIAWTILRTDMGAATAIGRLRRTDDRYVIDDPRLISTVEEFVADADHQGHLIPQPLRGGEVKQFVRGGTAISLVGSAGGFLPDSVVQDLSTGDLTPITRAPGYDETTILSPDERLGIVMTSRASARTNPAVLGLLPRPCAPLIGSALAWAAYTYTVTGVRQFREGNIGPVLIDIARSQDDPGYQGVALNDPAGDWVYVSPMSWHPDGKRVLWPETRRGSTQLRIRRAILLDHQPGPAVRPRPTPNSSPIAITGDAAAAALQPPAKPILAGRIAGQHSGHLEFERRPADPDRGQASSARVNYVDFSDDGLTWYNGHEAATSSFVADTVYQAELSATGELDGEMRLRITWSSITDPQPTRLRFDPDTDGRPKTHGYSRLGHIRLRVEDLAR